MSEYWTCMNYIHFFSLLEMSSLKIWETLLSWHPKCSLPLAVRISKTWRAQEYIVVLICLEETWFPDSFWKKNYLGNASPKFIFSIYSEKRTIHKTCLGMLYSNLYSNLIF